MHDPNVIVGFEGSEDAAVYKLSDDLGIIQTVDFFTPIVDDPYMFGQIAVANALSDVYAMGGKPITAMNLVCFPVKTLGLAMLREILRGGIDKLSESGTALVGGHSVEDNEPKYGLSVTGVIHPGKVITNRGAKIGDVLILTKPLGTGIVNTAIKAGLASDEAIKQVSMVMSTLNRNASVAMQKIGVHACTDITGFGLLGHLKEMLGSHEFTIAIRSDVVPMFPDVVEYAGMGLVPGGTKRNRDFCQDLVAASSDVGPLMLDILCDPQTSGGLLIAVSREKGDGLLQELQENGVPSASIIGEITTETKRRIAIE